MNDSTPLHEAAGHNQYLCVETLLRHRAPIDRYDGRFNTPLHRASHEGHSSVVRLLLSHRADVTRRNCDGYNSLELAVLNNHPITVQEFLQDPTWMDSLRNAQQSIGMTRRTDELSTPLRKLIRSMPQEAKEVFDRCINEIGRSDDDSYQMICNYEFLEDQLAMWRWKEGRMISPSPSPSPTHTLDALGRNHPLYLIITYHHYDLLKHPLINQLVRRKWLQFSRAFFWILFLFYGSPSFCSCSSQTTTSISGFFLASFTSTILRVHHPQYYYSLFNASISSVSCETISRNLLRHESFLLTKKNFYDTLIKWLLFLTIFIHVVKNLLLICIRVKMFFGLSNLLELIALILSVIFSHDFYSWQMSIRFRCSFQWQCGAVGILIGWITLSTSKRNGDRLIVFDLAFSYLRAISFGFGYLCGDVRSDSSQIPSIPADLAHLHSRLWSVVSHALTESTRLSTYLRCSRSNHSDANRRIQLRRTSLSRRP